MQDQLLTSMQELRKESARIFGEIERDMAEVMDKIPSIDSNNKMSKDISQGSNAYLSPKSRYSSRLQLPNIKINYSARKKRKTEVVGKISSIGVKNIDGDDFTKNRRTEVVAKNSSIEIENMDGNEVTEERKIEDALERAISEIEADVKSTKNQLGICTNRNSNFSSRKNYHSAQPAW